MKGTEPHDLLGVCKFFIGVLTAIQTKLTFYIILQPVCYLENKLFTDLGNQYKKKSIHSMAGTMVILLNIMSLYSNIIFNTISTMAVPYHYKHPSTYLLIGS